MATCTPELQTERIGLAKFGAAITRVAASFSISSSFSPHDTRSLAFTLSWAFAYFLKFGAMWVVGTGYEVSSLLAAPRGLDGVSHCQSTLTPLPLSCRF